MIGNDHDTTRCSATGTLPGRAGVVPYGAPSVRSSRDNETREALCLWRANRERRSTSASTKAVGS